MNFLKNNSTYILALLSSILIFHFIYHIETVIPTNINWLMAAYHDWGTHYLGWAFYRNDPWVFPLGNIESYNYPIGTNVGYTDSIPLLALLFKPFSALLPENFQYFGLWLLSCHILTAHYSYKIFELFKINKWVSFVATLLIVANPVLIFRGLHPALCAQWLIIASLYYYLVPSSEESVKKINKQQIILLLLSGLINPYLTAMLIGFNVILPLKNYLFDGTISLKKALKYIAISVISLLSIWYLVGLLEFNSKTQMDVANSYGMYGFNLNSFFNSFGFSSKIPALKTVSDAQYEGFAYLGIGFFVLIVLAILVFSYQLITNKTTLKNKKYLLPLFILSFFLFAFAVTNSVSYGTEVLFKYPVPGIIEKAGTIFRASGRFIWPVYYLILFFSIVAFSKIRINKFLMLGTFALIVFLQYSDTKLFFSFRNFTYGSYKTPLNEKEWNTLFSNCDAVITYKPFTNNLVYPMDYQDLSYLAMKNRKPISNGYVARENSIEKIAFTDSINKQILKGKLDKNYLFVTTLNEMDNFKFLMGRKDVEIKKLDNYFIVFKENDKNKKIKFDESPVAIKQIDSISQLYKNKKDFVQYNQNIKFTDDLKFYVEACSYDDDVLKVNGWMFIEKTNNNKGDSLYVLLSDGNCKYLIPSKTIGRGDITATYKKKYLDDSGFNIVINTSEIKKGNYQVGIAVKQKTSGKFYFSKTDKVVNIGFKEYKTPSLFTQKVFETPIISNLEHVFENDRFVRISGWGAIEKQDSKFSEIQFALVGKSGKTYTFETDLVSRNDVTTTNKNQYNYDNSGFSLKIRKDEIPRGTYKTAIIIKDTQKNKSFIKVFDKTIVI